MTPCSATGLTLAPTWRGTACRSWQPSLILRGRSPALSAPRGTEMAYARRLFCCRKQRALCARGFGDGDAGDAPAPTLPGQLELPGGKVAQLLASSLRPRPWPAGRRYHELAAGPIGAPDVDPRPQSRLSWTEARTCINKVRPLSSATSACVDQAPAQRKTRGSSKLRGTSPLTVLRSTMTLAALGVLLTSRTRTHSAQQVHTRS